MNPISDEQLNAFVDQQLDQEDRERVLEATVRDQQLAAEVYSLYQMKELVQQAYREPPLSPVAKNPLQRRSSIFRWAAMLIIGVLSVVTGYQWTSGNNFVQQTFVDARGIQSAHLTGKRVLLHIDSNDPARIAAAMHTVDMLMKEQRPAKIEVVANGAGLVMLRQGSPHAAGISSLSTRYANLEFKACGFAMEATRLKEGRPVILVPQAEKVDAALNEILRRLQAGWVYIKV